MPKNTNEILDSFDMNALRMERARKAARGGASLVDGLRQIAPEIEKLKVGQTAKLAIPDYDASDSKKATSAVRKFVMAITAKTSNLTVQGGDWAGRTFDIANDGAGYLYVQRGNDLKGADIPVRKRRGGGGRKAASSNENTGTSTGETQTEVSESGARVTEAA